MPIYPSHLIRPLQMRRSRLSLEIFWGCRVISIRPPADRKKQDCPCFPPSILSTDCHILFTNKRLTQSNKWMCACSWTADLHLWVAQLLLNGANVTAAGALILIGKAATHTLMVVYRTLITAAPSKNQSTISDLNILDILLIQSRTSVSGIITRAWPLLFDLYLLTRVRKHC